MPAYMVAQYRSAKEYAAYRTAVVVIIEFASLTVAQQFYQSEEYAAVKALRQGAPPISIVVVDGVPGE